MLQQWLHHQFATSTPSMNCPIFVFPVTNCVLNEILNRMDCVGQDRKGFNILQVKVRSWGGGCFAFVFVLLQVRAFEYAKIWRDKYKKRKGQSDWCHLYFFRNTVSREEIC